MHANVCTALHFLQEPQGFVEFIGGFCFGESGETAVQCNVVVIAGEQELLRRYFYMRDMVPRGHDFDFLANEQVARLFGELAEAVCPLAFQVIYIIRS